MRVIYIFSKYVWVLPLKDKKILQYLTLFRNFLMNLGANQIKNALIKTAHFVTLLEKNDKEMYSTQNEGKSVAAERL